MADKQSSQGQTLQRAQEKGRDPSSATVWGQPGFQPPKEPQTFVWEGDMSAAPDWVDRGWAGYDAGPALNVPQGDPATGPYTTKVARLGDTVTYTPGPGGSFGGFGIVTAQESGRQPGIEVQAVNPETFTPTFRPAAQTEADLHDLVRTGLVDPADMDPDAKAQYDARTKQKGGTASYSAEAAGHIPSKESPQQQLGAPTPDSENAPPTPDQDEQERQQRHQRDREQDERQRREQQRQEQGGQSQRQPPRPTPRGR